LSGGLGMTDLLQALAPWVAEAVRQAVSHRPELAGLRLTGARRLSGGAINQNFLVTLGSETVDGVQWVMRRSQSQSIPGSHDRRSEFAIIRYADDRGVVVPTPIAVVTHDGQQASFFAYLTGDTDARRLVSTLGGRKPTAPTPNDVAPMGISPDAVSALTESLGEQLGRLHRHTQDQQQTSQDLEAILGAPGEDSVEASLQEVEKSFSRLSRPAGYLRFAVRSLRKDRPFRKAQRPPSLCHNDFRLGNLMMLMPTDAQSPGQSAAAGQATGPALSAVLDWEFSGWGDPMADIGWLTAPCWRFGGAMPVAGFGNLEDLLRGYGRENPEPLPIDELAFWQRLAHVRWAIIAAQQGERVVHGDPESVELLITGAMTASIVQPVVEYYLGEAVSPSPLAGLSADQQAVDQWLLETSLLIKSQLAPSLSSATKYQALMAANALRLARARLRSVSVSASASERPKVSGSALSSGDDFKLELAQDLAIWSFKD
jgi:aminoglycoside phosphotransferase (APT) family kinase protein